ncbi:hypothetical protein HPB50_017134 [Hyalomma asiaticum]|uniref:Uncharacterized protein n=1 Tax=Hyalomma asiaticum TaxID=266040 RepID=A0ACB7SR75_HYAAI|nr:hypothetical protein HPB50_017134 [Hyalomma asiaticum]
MQSMLEDPLLLSQLRWRDIKDLLVMEVLSIVWNMENGETVPEEDVICPTEPQSPAQDDNTEDVNTIDKTPEAEDSFKLRQASLAIHKQELKGNIYFTSLDQITLVLVRRMRSVKLDSQSRKDKSPSTAPSTLSEGDSDSTAEPSGTSEDKEASTSESSAETAGKAPKIKTARQSSARAQEIKLFFEEMERLQTGKEEQKAAREEQRRQRHKERS